MSILHCLVGNSHDIAADDFADLVVRIVQYRVHAESEDSGSASIARQDLPPLIRHAHSDFRCPHERRQLTWLRTIEETSVGAWDLR